MTVSTTWVFAESAEGAPATSTLELLSKARQLSATVEAFHAGPVSTELAAELGRYGASRVHSTGELGATLVGAPAAAGLAAAIEQGDGDPGLILAAMTYGGRDLLGRLSARLDRPVVTDGTDVRSDGDTVLVDKPIFGGRTVVTTALRAPPYLVGIRPGSFPAEPATDPHPPGVSTVDLPELGPAGAAVVAARHAEARAGPRLDDAAVVVAGGRGLGTPDRFELVEELARLLHGAPGATRAVVDAGWVPYAYQIGQTGKTVRPEVYLALGISGATQHLVGMNGARHIIAIDKDAEAPILAIADLGIVGDVHQVVPRLIEALRSRG
ncbi:MAG TPA: electron transfer flavoprotein subunit alpha/FixB family protein [Actinomycetes bacterium]|nr:electron transfer flavoprotein subunit alpha/FixB family protein [Actinomycetes bacterium]